MKKIFALPIVLVSLLIILVAVFVFSVSKNKSSIIIPTNTSEVPLPTQNSIPQETQADVPQVSVIAEGLKVPWAFAFLPEGGMLVNEREGRVRLITKDGSLKSEPVLTLTNVKHTSESGLHGIALHPNFLENSFIFLYYTYSSSGGNTLNRVSRFVYENERLVNEKVVVDNIPGAPNHDGGRIKFGPDKLLYITTGDAQQPSLAQDTNSLAGKILRVTDSGDPAPGNPFNNRAYSYGHRNPQGIAWDNDGILWETEHGPSGAETGNDEFNQIKIGGNYGWPDIRGDQTKEGMISPVLESGKGNTWAPAGLAFVDGSFYFAGLRGQTLYEVKNASTSPELFEHFKNELGRLREVAAGPDGMLYVTTSNRDGRGFPKNGDDKVLRINPAKL